MLQAAGVVLKGGVKVGLRRMPSIAGFGEQTNIRESDPFDHSTLLIQIRPLRFFPIRCVGKNEHKQQRLDH